MIATMNTVNATISCRELHNGLMVICDDRPHKTSTHGDEYKIMLMCSMWNGRRMCSNSTRDKIIYSWMHISIYRSIFLARFFAHLRFLEGEREVTFRKLCEQLLQQKADVNKTKEEKDRVACHQGYFIDNRLFFECSDGLLCRLFISSHALSFLMDITTRCNRDIMMLIGLYQGRMMNEKKVRALCRWRAMIHKLTTHHGWNLLHSSAQLNL